MNEEVRRLTGQPLITGVIVYCLGLGVRDISLGRRRRSIHVRSLMEDLQYQTSRPAAASMKDNVSKDAGRLGVPDRKKLCQSSSVRKG